MPANPLSRIRSGSAATAAAIITTLIVVALGNQGLQSWRQARATDTDRWIADAFQPLTATGWRLTPGSETDATAHWLAPLVLDLLLIILTGLFTAVAARNRGRGALFLTTWQATTLAGAIAGLASAPLAYAGIPGIATADVYRANLLLGITLGFLIGVINALVAVLAAGGKRARSDSPAETPSAPLPDPEETWPTAP